MHAPRLLTAPSRTTCSALLLSPSHSLALSLSPSPPFLPSSAASPFLASRCRHSRPSVNWISSSAADDNCYSTHRRRRGLPFFRYFPPLAERRRQPWERAKGRGDRGFVAYTPAPRPHDATHARTSPKERSRPLFRRRPPLLGRVVCCFSRGHLAAGLTRMATRRTAPHRTVPHRAAPARVTSRRRTTNVSLRPAVALTVASKVLESALPSASFFSKLSSKRRPPSRPSAARCYTPQHTSRSHRYRL